MNKYRVDNKVLFPEMERLLHEGHTVTFTPDGRSMLPFIRGGADSVTLEYRDSVRVGDILLVRLPEERYVLHRLIRVEGNTLVLMGDGNLLGTESCCRADVLGTVVQIFDSAGRPKRLYRGHLWAALRPFRKYLLKIYRKLEKLQEKL